MKNQISRRELIKIGAIGGLASLGVSKVFGVESVQPSASILFADGFKDGKYVQPPLPYKYDALEPLYDAKTVEIHYTKHHAASVKGLNSTLEKLQAARAGNDYSSIKSLSRDLAFNGSGHILHCLFWLSMKQAGSAIPSELSKAMIDSFGTVEAATAQFAAAAKAVESNGWGILAYEPMSGKLMILQCEKHQNLAVWSAIPLLVCDVWEHAYYLKYANDRSLWVDNFMKLADWEFAAARLAKVKMLQ